MALIIFVLGYLAIALCLATLLRPAILRQILNFFFIGSRIYLAGLLRIIVGVLLLILASRARLWWYVVTVGLLAAGSGLSVCFFALRRTKKLLARIKNQSNLTLRLYAFLGLLMWSLLIYSLLPLNPFCPLR